MKHRCPICNKVITSLPQEKLKKGEFFPFCSLRCKLVDLGSWLDSNYKIISTSDSSENEFEQKV
ncbi:MAG: DNA gyrase inhibitor YacG [Planctomycetes bacterium]|nr:DNA gyrase inhibitor YacG [Planctomycetota bacterium]